MPCTCQSVAEQLADDLARLQFQSGEPKKRFDAIYARKIGMPISRFTNIRQKRARRIDANEVRAIRGLIASGCGEANGNGVEARIVALEKEIQALKESFAGR